MMRILQTVFFILLCNTVFAGADLEIKTLKGFPAADFKLQFLVTNHGPDAANHAGCNVYFYADERLVLSQAFRLSPVPSGTSRKEELVLDFPDQAVTTIKVEVFDSTQPDVQPSTNSMQMNIRPPDLRNADLQIVDVKSEDKTQKGRELFKVRLRNNGPDKISGTKLDVNLEVFGRVIATSDKKVGGLDSQEEVEMRVQVPNAGIIQSTNGVLVLRWMSPEVDDSETANNVYKLPVPLNLRMPDLLPLKTGLDKQGVLTFAVNNKGNARAEATVTALYINGALVERFNTPELGPNGTSRHRYNSAKLTVDDKIVIVTDFNADVEEASEENNRQLVGSQPPPRTNQ